MHLVAIPECGRTKGAVERGGGVAVNYGAPLMAHTGHGCVVKEPACLNGVLHKI